MKFLLQSTGPLGVVPLEKGSTNVDFSLWGKLYVFTVGQKIKKSPVQKNLWNQMNQFHDFFFKYFPYFFLKYSQKMENIKEIKKNPWNWFKNDSFHFTSFLAWTCSNFLANCASGSSSKSSDSSLWRKESPSRDYQKTCLAALINGVWRGQQTPDKWDSFLSSVHH